MSNTKKLKFGAMSAPKKDYLPLAKECFLNAKNLHNSGKTLYDNGNIGNAVSLIVLATEESIKAFLFIVESLGKSIKHNNTDLAKGLLSNHSKKHEVSKYIYTSVLYLQEIIPLFQGGIDVIENQLPDKVDEIFSSDFTKKYEDWFDNADNLKQRGFYVSYLEKQIVSPNMISNKDYELSLFISNNILALLDIMISTIEIKNNNLINLIFFYLDRFESDKKKMDEIENETKAKGNR